MFVSKMLQFYTINTPGLCTKQTSVCSDSNWWHKIQNQLSLLNNT